ncbi:MAG: DnaB-like helicase C-terminal domain-containing protein, partial [Nitrososphaerota archaeon]
MSIVGLTSLEQWDEYTKVETDPRPRVRSGYPELDALLHRASFGPGTFVILAGRMHTRKTAVMLNLIANMLQDGVPVGLVGLDEAPHMYVAKLASVLTQTPHTDFHQLWGTPQMDVIRDTFVQTAQKLSLVRGHRPSLDSLSAWLELAEIDLGERPRVVFIDYLALLARDRFDGKDQQRIPRLCEELQVWTNKHELVTIALHQVGRQGDGSARVHGHTPVTPEQLMYG